MAKTYSTSPGRKCRIGIEFDPANAAGLPPRFSCYIEFMGPDGTDGLKSSDFNQLIQGHNLYLDIPIPEDAGLGKYIATHFEMRVGDGNARQVKEISASGMPLPIIELRAAEGLLREPAWPTVIDRA